MYAFLQEIAQRELRNSEARYQDLYDNAPDMFISVDDATANILQCNQMLETVLGRPREEIIGRSVWELYPADSQGKIREAVETFRTTGQVKNVELQLQRRDGGRVDVILNASAVRDTQGRILHSRSVLRDITEQKRAESILKENEQFLQSVFHAIQDGISVLDTDLNIVRVNTWIEQMYVHHMPLPGKKCYEAYQNRQSPCPWCPTLETLQTGKTHRAMVPYPSPERPNGWIDLSSFPLKDVKGNITGVIEYVKDITEQKEAEAEMQKLAAIVKRSSELINLATLDGRMIFLNDAGCSMLGIEPEQVEQVQIMEVIPEPLKELVENELLPGLMKGDGWEGELQYLNLKTKKLIDVYAVTFTVQDPASGAPLYLANVSLDITDRKQAEEALREREETIRALVESSRDWIWSIDIQGVHTYCNPAIKNILGYSADELVGKHSLDIIHEEDRKRIESELPKRIAEKRGWKNLILRWRHKDGDYRYLESNAVPILTSQDELIGFRGVDRDITDRKRAEAEREKLIQELEAKNAELERFTYTVSHDLKSPLITTKGFVGMLKQDLADGNQELIAEDMQRISHATETMERLLEELLELSRIGRIVNPPKQVFLSDLAQEALALLAGEPNAQNTQFEVAPDLPVVYGDRIRLREVLQNLIENSIKFMGDQTEPRIEIGHRQEKGETVFYIRDNGIGIDSRYHEKIFGLFDKLNSEAAGTGIGLTIVKRIVEVHGGRIWVESEGIGRGSTFCFTLASHKEGD